MYIRVKGDGHDINIAFPSGLLLNPGGAVIASGYLTGKSKDADEKTPKLNPAAMIKLFHAINQCRRRFPDWYIVEVESSDGEEVKIKL